MNVTTGSVRRLCESCRGQLYGGWVGDNQFVYNSVGGGIGLLRVVSNESVPLINADVLEPRGSPDAKWLAFHTVAGLDIRQVFVAPLRTIPIPRSDWIPITDEKGLNRNAAWAPDGGRLYYVSDRDGFRCIWARNLDAATKRPVGEAFAVYHVHNTRFALMNFVAQGRISLSATKNEVFYSQPELTGNIWMLESPTAAK